MIRQQPRPTLFPYTTLFRSQRRDLRKYQPVRFDVRREIERFVETLHAPLAVGVGSVLLGDAGDRQNQIGQLRRLRQEQDRKSTRLNSSHSQISYAVFCLKKT